MDQTVQSFQDLRKGVFNERSKDLFLAFIIAMIGFAGSYLVLGKSIQDSSKDVNNADNSLVSEFNLKKFTGTQRGNYNFQEENLLIQGSMIVGGFTRITNLAFNPNNQYLIDFGNGTRYRMTAPVVSRQYNSPGFYLVQCYIMRDDKWELIAAETITVRKEN